MHQPSRVLQKCAYNTSKRIRTVERNANLRVQDVRHFFGIGRLHCTKSAYRYACVCQKYNKYYRCTNIPLLSYSGSRSLHPRTRQLSTCATSPRQDATTQKVTPSAISQDLDQAELDLSDGKAIDWNKLVLHMDRIHGAHGVCATMDRLRERENLDIVMKSDYIKSVFVYAGIQSPSNRQKLFTCAENLLQQFDYRWPNLYTKCMHKLLEQGDFKDAVETHLRLATDFLPDQHILDMFFENFVSNPDTRMQDTLEEIYLSLPQHNLYDIIIPVLFDSGQSRLAKRWRRTFLRKSDSPSSESSGQFIIFLASYYTNTNFTAAERRVLDLTLERCRPKRSKKGSTIRCMATRSKTSRNTGANRMTSYDRRLENTGNTSQPQPQARGLVDGVLEKLFASSWTPASFAMQLAKNAGIRSIGPRAFQALALRSNSAIEVHELIKTLQNLDISIPAGAYCTAVSEFARQGKDSLLRNLLHSDIHPEEFDDEETRQMILENSIRRQNVEQETLMRGVINVLAMRAQQSLQPSPFQLATIAPAFSIEKLLFDEPWRMKLALERLVSLGYRIGSIEASAILRRAFAAFPMDRRGIVWNSHECIRILDEVIGVIRCIAAQDVAIRAEYWKILLLGLGHQGRLDMLEQLSLEVVKMYDHSLGGLFPVHKADMPKMTKLATACLRRTETAGYIPADLSYYHHHHPLFKIFDGNFQRTTVKFGFDWALNVVKGTSLKSTIQNAVVTNFNVASGIHILAKLRDRGVFIDMDLVESAARNGLYSCQRLRQRDGEPRYRHWLSSTQMKEVIDAAWGSTLIPAGYIIGLGGKDFRALSSSYDTLDAHP